MVFNSLHFLWFFAAVYLLYRAAAALLPTAPAHRAQNWLLLIASYYFYAAWDYRFLALLAASTLVDYTCGLMMGRATDRALGRARRRSPRRALHRPLALAECSLRARSPRPRLPKKRDSWAAPCVEPLGCSRARGATTRR